MSEKVEKLLKLRDLIRRRNRLRLKNELSTPTDLSNVNYRHLRASLEDPKISGAALEGSSRSAKTWSGIDMIIFLCTEVEKNCTINIYRETYTEFKETLYEDFKRRLDDFDLNNPFKRVQEVKSFKIGNNKIAFLGCDKLGSKHGAGADYLFFNEIMHIPNAVFDQAEMRCRKFWWADYNPSFTDHWFFDKVLKRPDVSFLRSTFKDNRHISEKERNKILSYEPWQPGSYSVEDNQIIYKGKPVDERNQPPPNIDNIDHGTADVFMWKVYGLGLRGEMKGLIFNHIKYVDTFPEDVGFFYGLDFGFTADPTALVKFGQKGKDIFVELLCYEPIETPETLAEYFEKIGVDKRLPMIADSADKYTGENKGTVEMVSGIRKFGYRCQKVSKTKSVMYWLLQMKKHKIHIVKNNLYRHAKKEAENYKFKEINGITINQPEDRFNHFWDAARYAFLTSNNKTSIW